MEKENIPRFLDESMRLKRKVLLKRASKDGKIILRQLIDDYENDRTIF